MKTEKDFEKYLNSIKEIAKKEGFDSLDKTYIEHLRARFFEKDVVIGKTSRICLRELKMADLEAFYRFEDALSEPILQSFIKESKEASKIHLRSYIQNMYPLYDYGIWAVEKCKTGEVIGLCGLGQTEIAGEICTDVGYYICPKCRKKGFASECIEIVLDYVKNYLEFPCIYAIIKEENRISKGILRKFGFEYVKKYEEVLIFQKDLKE